MSVAEQLEASLAAMGAARAGVFYLHAPDRATSLDDTLPAVQQLFEAGKLS